MWKLALISIAAVLSTVQGWEPTYPRVREPTYESYGRTGVESWDNLLAELMKNSANTGTCGPLCYVEVGDVKMILEQDSEPVVIDCVSYRCTPTSVIAEDVACPDDSTITCASGVKLILYPEKCCRQCEGTNKPPVQFRDWAEWTECSATCGGGRRARRRECQVAEDDTLVDCTGELLDTGDCNEDPCPIPCEWEYGPYEQCSASCGFGIRERFPVITQHPQHGGMPCPPFVENNVPEQSQCKIQDCPTDCIWEYGPYEECTATCNGGTRTRYPEIITPATNGGTCPAHVLNNTPDIEPCNTQPCPEPCEWEYSAFTDCSVTCGGGVKTRHAVITRPAMHGGECNLPQPESASCNSQPCPFDCVWVWGSYGSCSVTCGGGVRTRSPVVTTPAMHGGVCNLPQDQTETCSEEVCPMVCPTGQNACPNRQGVLECIPDKDGDCIEDSRDNCENRYNPMQEDQEYDGVGDLCDNCPKRSNPGQENSDGDVTGNACDVDDDNDGVDDADDNCNYVPNSDQKNTDRDDYGDACDNCPLRKSKNINDADGDGVGNPCDNCRYVYNPQQLDSEADNPNCNVRPAYLMDYDEYEVEEEEEDDAVTDSDKKALATQIMEKLLQLYYSN